MAGVVLFFLCVFPRLGVQLHRRSIDVGVELVLPAQHEAVLPDVPADGVHRFRWRVPAVKRGHIIFFLYDGAFSPWWGASRRQVCAVTRGEQQRNSTVVL